MMANYSSSGDSLGHLLAIVDFRYERGLLLGLLSFIECLALSPEQYLPPASESHPHYPQY